LDANRYNAYVKVHKAINAVV